MFPMNEIQLNHSAVHYIVEENFFSFQKKKERKEKKKEAKFLTKISKHFIENSAEILRTKYTSFDVRSASSSDAKMLHKNSN